MVWLNKDGLRVKFGYEAVVDRDPRGEAQGAGDIRVIDIIIDVAKTTAATPYIFDNAIIPANSYIQKVEADVLVAITGATALDFGLQYYDGTEYDYDGLITDLPALTVGSRVEAGKGGTGAGALVGTTLASPGYLAVTLTGQATAGKVSLRAHVLVPAAAPAVVWHGA
jgi:hypothetical protein